MGRAYNRPLKLAVGTKNGQRCSNNRSLKAISEGVRSLRVRHKANFGAEEKFCQVARLLPLPGFTVCISPVSALAVEASSGHLVFAVLKDSTQKGEEEGGCTSIRGLVLCSALCIYCVFLCQPPVSFTHPHVRTLTCDVCSRASDSVWVYVSHSPNP